jgi:hypothetical protein
MDVVDNKKKNDSIQKEQISIYENIQSIKDLVSQYESGENVHYIRDAVEIYINQLTPKIQNLNKLKFSYRDVVYDSDDDTYHFVEKQYTIDEIETNYAKHEIGVENLIIGVKEEKTKNTSKKKLKPTNAPAKAPIIAQPKIIMQIGEEEDDEEDEEDLPVSVPKEPTYLKLQALEILNKLERRLKMEQMFIKKQFAEKRRYMVRLMGEI